MFKDNLSFAKKYNVPTNEIEYVFNDFASLNFSREYINDVYEQEACKYINKAYYSKFEGISAIDSPLLLDGTEILSDDNSD